MNKSDNYDENIFKAYREKKACWVSPDFCNPLEDRECL